METVTTPSVRFNLRDDGILEMERLPTGECLAGLIPEQTEGVRRLTGDTLCPALWKPHGAPVTEAAGWRQWIEEVPHLFTAVAIVHDEESDGPLPSFVDVLPALLTPLEVFADEEEAVEWLSRFQATPR